MQKISDSTSSADAAGEFTEGSAAAGVPATLITANWLNGIQRELLAILTKAGLAPDAGDFEQLSKAIFNSPAFSGSPTAPTAAQFGADTSIATTAFVQRALGNFSTQASVNTTCALTLDMAGQIINCGGTITVTLPTGTAGAVGATFQVNNSAGGSVTVKAPAGQNLYAVGSGTPRTFALGPGDTVTIAYVGGGSWYAWNGVQLGLSASFGSQTQTTGYQKLPTGYIRQWGIIIGMASGANTVVTLPVALAAAPFSIQVTLADFTGDKAVGTTPIPQVRNSTSTTITIRNLSGASESYFWEVIGKI